MTRSRLQFALLVLLVGLVLLREARDEPGAEGEARFHDWVVANSEHAWPAPALAVITIGDASVAQRAWPRSPLDYTLFVQAALGWEPSVLGIEPVLAWAEPVAPENPAKQREFERILQDYLRRAPKVLLGAELGFPEDADVIPELQTVPLLRQVKGSVQNVPEFTSVEHQPVEELRLGATLGFTNAPAAGGGLVRAVPLLFRYRGQIVPSFALQAVMLAAQLTPDEVQVELGGEINLGGKIHVPIDATGALAANFALPVAHFDYDDLLLAAEQTQGGTTPVIAPQSLQGKMILLIRDDAATRTLRIPGGRSVSNGELMTAAIATMESGAFVQPASFAVSVGIIAATMVLAWFAAGWSSPATILASVVVLLAYVIGAIELAERTALILPGVLPLGLLCFLALARLVFGRKSTRPTG